MRERYDLVMWNAAAPSSPMVAYAPGPASPLSRALPPEEPEPSLLKPILRHWWLVVLFAVIGVAAAVAYVKQAQPLYTSTSKIYIQPTSGFEVTELGLSERASYLNTQVEVIKSTPLLKRALQQPGMQGLRTFQLGKIHDPMWYLLQALDVDLERKTDLIVVSIDSPYAEEAATIVSAVVNAYTDYMKEEKDDRSHKLLESTREMEKQEQAKLDRMQDQIKEFRTKNANIDFRTDGSAAGNIAFQELATISQRLTEAQLATIDAKSTYAPGHPQVQKAQRREEQIYGLYQEAQAKTLKVNSKTAEYQRLIYELEPQRNRVKLLGDKIHQFELAASGPKMMNIDVVEPARVAEWPSYPRPKRTMAVAALAGVLLGAGLALLRDRLDGRLRSVEEIQTVIGLPILGVVPAMSGRRTAVARAMTVHLDPRSVVAEAYRTIRTAVYFGTTGSRCKTILLTSPEPGDGKTTCASNLAIAIAQTGRSVLLLDADFRKPTQHKNLDIKDALGLSSVLAGRESLERAIQRTGVEGLDILPCGPIPSNPSEILNSREFGELVDGLCGRYDHIIFDSPPVNAVTDARILGAVCDATVLVLRADKSTKKAGEHARNALLAVGARMLGAIVNDAPKGKGYEVYGGSYYGPVDVTSYGDSKKSVPPSRRLAPPAMDEEENGEEEDPGVDGSRRDIA